MTTQVEVTMILADHVQEAQGKLNMIGGGWTFTPPAEHAVPFGIGLIISVPWDETNKEHTLHLVLETEDGQPVLDPDGSPVQVTLQFEIGRPPGVRHGTALDQMLALNSSPMQLPADSGFEWLCRMGDQVLARRPFRTYPMPSSAS